MHLAKEVATLQELSGARFRLGVGMGWHKDEYDFMGIPFEGRGRRGDEAIRVMRARWSGDRDFDGEFWSFHDAMSEPHPSPQPEIWGRRQVGARDPAGARVGDVWHPSRGSDPEHVRRVKEEHPELRVIPRVAAESAEAMLEAGAEGAVVSFADEAAMRDFAGRYS
jgi:alkanesulfonate monooxygenase SsuD/methylene tetrahydromethanopterin reductase-like flavin-dependent oxidoreductase (luciferase family)